MQVEFLKQEVEISDVKFQINKLNAIDSFRLLEKIRFEISQNNKLAASSEEINFSTLINLISSFSPDFVSDVQNKIFSKILFCRKGDTAFLELSPAMYETAFEKGDAADVYQLLLRGLYVNFFSSFQKLTSLKTLSNPNPLID